MKFEKTAKALDLLLTGSGYEYRAEFSEMTLKIRRPRNMDAQISMAEDGKLDSEDAQMILCFDGEKNALRAYGRNHLDMALLARIEKAWAKACTAWLWAVWFDLDPPKVLTGTPEPTEEEA